MVVGRQLKRLTNIIIFKDYRRALGYWCVQFARKRFVISYVDQPSFQASAEKNVNYF